MSATISDGQWKEFWKKKAVGVFDADDFQWVIDHWQTIHNLRLGNFRAVDVAERVVSMASGFPASVVPVFSAIVTYIQPNLAELKQKFSWVNSDYAKADFKPIDRCKDVSRDTREVAFEYVHMGRDASTDEVLAEMDRHGLRPALYEELLAFGAKYPDEQRQFPIIALGSVWRGFGGRLRVAYLSRGGSERSLSLYWFGGDWNGFCRFLAVRK